MTRLYHFQLEGALQIRAFRGRALLADEQGLGKTLQALYWCFKTKRARPIIVVCPASLKYNWQREAAMHVSMGADVLEGTKPYRRGLVAHQPIIVINYEILHAWKQYLKRLAPQVVIVDECHYIKNTGTRNYRSVKSLCRGVPHVIGLSGTPLTNRPAELWGILSILRPDKFDSRMDYLWAYTNPQRRPWGIVFKGGKNLSELHRRLRRLCMIRRLKRDVLPELPRKVRRLVTVELRDRTEYAMAERDLIKWLKMRRGETRAKKAAKAEQLARLGYLMRLAARLKVPDVKEWIDNFLENSDEKLVVFSVNRPMIDLLVRRYRNICVRVDGTVKGKERFKAVERFQHDPKCRLFIGHPRAAGVGLTLTASFTVFFCDFPWTPGDLEQAEDRVHRIGQKQRCFIYYLVARNTVEEKLIKLLREKKQHLDAVLDGIEASHAFDVFDGLLLEFKHAA